MWQAFVYIVIVKNTVHTNPFVTNAYSHYFLWAKVPAECDLLKWRFSGSSWLQRTRVSCTCTPYFELYIYTLFTGFIAEIHVNFTVLELSGIFPHVRTTEQLNKLFICTVLSKIVRTFQFCFKAESTYIALHTSPLTYSYLLDQKISHTTIVMKVKYMFLFSALLPSPLGFFLCLVWLTMLLVSCTIWHEIVRC